MYIRTYMLTYIHSRTHMIYIHNPCTPSRRKKTKEEEEEGQEEVEGQEEEENRRRSTRRITVI